MLSYKNFIMLRLPQNFLPVEILPKIVIKLSNKDLSYIPCISAREKRRRRQIHNRASPQDSCKVKSSRLLREISTRQHLETAIRTIDLFTREFDRPPIFAMLSDRIITNIIYSLQINIRKT